ncbi:MAG: class I SAM-dependent methyltransferase family protein [Candidatus Bathyarchaeota archaeon]|nr:class I SAM-dependent methyltransferase family protein [Candidatus Bathyarchaeota archaeon]
MRKRLKEKLALPSGQLGQVYNSFDIIGDIAIVKTPPDSNVDMKIIAKQIMQVHKNVKTVFAQTSAVRGDFRVRELRLLAGEGNTNTTYKESGCIFAVDVEKCYFSPRLSHERARVASQVKAGEVVVNMFSGVGCFSVIIAKTVPQVQIYSIDVNPTAFECMQKNVRINRVYGRVIPLLGDAKEIIQAKLQGVADRVLMPLPEKALEYLPVAVSALKKGGGWIHYYDFQHVLGNEDPLEKTKSKIVQKLDHIGVRYTFAHSRVVRSTGPNWYQTVADINALIG